MVKKKEKVENLKTSELLDRLNIELNKEEMDDDVVREIESEIDNRMPFKYIENRIEGSEDEDGIRNQIEELQKEIEELKETISKHNHKEGKVVVEL